MFGLKSNAKRVHTVRLQSPRIAYICFQIFTPLSISLRLFTKIDYSDKRSRASDHGDDQNPTPPRPSSSYMTRAQEHQIMVSALRQVISKAGSDTSASNGITSESPPLPDAGPCPLCGVTGSYGCAFQQRTKISKRRKSTKE